MRDLKILVILLISAVIFGSVGFSYGISQGVSEAVVGFCGHTNITILGDSGLWICDYDFDGVSDNPLGNTISVGVLE